MIFSWQHIASLRVLAHRTSTKAQWTRSQSSGRKPLSLMNSPFKQSVLAFGTPTRRQLNHIAGWSS
jgi:hypothetical protein